MHEMQPLQPLSMPQASKVHGNPHALAQDAKTQAEKDRDTLVQFEAILVRQLFAAMRKTSFTEKKDFGADTFQEMFDEQVAQHIAEQGLGLTDTLLSEFQGSEPQEVKTPVDRGTTGAVLTPKDHK